MIPTQSMIDFPTFGDNATKVKPDDPKYAAGFQAGDVLPAEWHNWMLNRASGAVSTLNPGVRSIEQEINNVLTAASVTPDAEETNQLASSIAALISAAILDEQQKPAVGVPTLWMGPKPDWALDFGNGASTKYLWANYPKLNNTRFKGLLQNLIDLNNAQQYDSSGFYVPDLRGIVPIGYGTNARRTSETLDGGNSPGWFLSSQNKYHNHGGSFSGNEINSVLNKNDGTPWTNGSSTLVGGGMVANYSTVNYFLQTGSSSASRLTGLGVKFTPGGTVTVGYEGTTKQASKPATIGCMWIVRFE